MPSVMRLAANDWFDVRSVTPEAVNRWTHAAGFGLSLPAAIVLMAIASKIADPLVVAAFGIYCVALAGLYAASALSHAFEERPRVRKAFRTADQVCIYLMIAGTFTPFAAAYLRTPFGLAQLGGMWLLAAVGIVLRIKRRGALIGPLDVAFCILTGWIPVLSLGQIFAVAGLDGFALILAGGLFYSGGTVFLLNDHRQPYLHGVWHLSALAGTACHYAFLLCFVALA
jgi:hemolysin III